MESLSGRSTVVTGVFVMILLVSALAAQSDLTYVRFAQDIEQGAVADEVMADEIDVRQAMIGGAQVSLFVLCAITFLMWFHRSHKNLVAGNVSDLRFSSGWAIGGFFVPFLNLVRPFHVMQEVWAGSVQLSRHAEDESGRETSPASYVGVWWALFLVSNLIANIAGRMTLNAETLDEMVRAGWVMMASDLMDIPSALVALLLVRRITAIQEQARMHLLVSASTGVA